MANKWKKVAAIAVSLAMASSIAVGMTGCKKTVAPYEVNKRERTGWKDEKEYTYNSYTGQMPSAWNELTQSDSANSNLTGYINGAFFEFDYKYDANGEVVPGDFTVQYSGATALEDVTTQYAGQYGLASDATKYHAFKITLRQDLQWDDGTPIKAEDFVYTMEQQLSPDYLFDNASNYYSSNYIIHNAKNFVYQGQTVMASCMIIPGEKYTEFTLNSGDSCYYNSDNEKILVAVKTSSDWSSNSLQAYYNAGYFAEIENAATVIPAAIAAADAKGYVPLNEELAAVLDAFCKKVGGGYANEWKEFCAFEHTYPTMNFNEVGYFAPSDYELVLIIDNTLAPINDDGSLNYHAAYELAGFPLVKKSLWEANADKSRTPWINTYCSSLASSASWGPYKLTNFEADTTYTVSRNDKWYGYKMERYDDQFQADKITVRNVKEWNTAWLSFQKGEFDTVSINTSIASKYKNSSQAYFTPSTGSGLINFQSNAEALTKERGNIMLKYPEFRQAMSLAMDRADFAATQTTSSLPLLGCLNDMYYYDVENGKVYRESVQAKEGLLRAYGATKGENGNWTVGGVEYDDIDDAMDALTGYNVTLARQLVQQAYDKALAAGDIKAGDKITLTWGVINQNADTDRERKWLENSFKQALVGTPLQGKLEVKYFTTTNDTWIDDFIEDGKYDICFGGWQNAAFNPYYLFNAAFLLDENRYAVGWDPTEEYLTLTVEGDGTEECPTYENLEMNLKAWGAAMNGTGSNYDFSNYPTDTRLTILAALEEAVLKTYWSIPVYAQFSASLISYKIDYYSYEYNTFMGYGGLQYMTFNYDDTEWAEFVKSKGTLIYNFNEIKVKNENVSDAD